MLSFFTELRTDTGDLDIRAITVRFRTLERYAFDKSAITLEVAWDSSSPVVEPRRVKLEKHLIRYSRDRGRLTESMNLELKVRLSRWHKDMSNVAHARLLVCATDFGVMLERSFFSFLTLDLFVFYSILGL